MIRVAMTSELSWQRNDAIIYFISVLRTVLPKSFTGAFSINNRLDVREANKKQNLWERYRDILDGVFMVRNTVKTGQS